MEISQTERGFAIGEFTDRYGAKCSLQKSSLATEDAIWLGVNDANPQIMASDAKKLGLTNDENVGWIKFNIPKEVLLNTRMHLTRDMVKNLIPILEKFVKTGELK
jgi:hypothetical protein